MDNHLSSETEPGQVLGSAKRTISSTLGRSEAWSEPARPAFEHEGDEPRTDLATLDAAGREIAVVAAVLSTLADYFEGDRYRRKAVGPEEADEVATVVTGAEKAFTQWHGRARRSGIGRLRAGGLDDAGRDEVIPAFDEVVEKAYALSNPPLRSDSIRVEPGEIHEGRIRRTRALPRALRDLTSTLEAYGLLLEDLGQGA